MNFILWILFLLEKLYLNTCYFRHILIYIQNNFSVLKGKWTSVQCTHQPCTELFFSGGGVWLIILLSLSPGVGGGGYVPAASIIGTFTTRLDAHMQSLLIKRYIFFNFILPKNKLSILDTYLKNVAAVLIYTHLRSHAEK